MALGACEQKISQQSSAAPPPGPLAEIVSTHPQTPHAAPPAAPAAPPAAAEVADPFELLDRAKAKAKTPAPAMNFDDVQKDAVRRARELRAESDRVRETL